MLITLRAVARLQNLKGYLVTETRLIESVSGEDG